jgi:hypothetical protein
MCKIIVVHKCLFPIKSIVFIVFVMSYLVYFFKDSLGTTHLIFVFPRITGR